MTLIVEDGTRVSGANSFVTVAEADAYFEARIDTTWTDADDEQKERALVLAADYMTQAWRLLWNGSISDGTQALAWPRRGVPVPDFFDPFLKQGNVPLAFQDTYFIPEEGTGSIPQEIKDAQFLLARAQLDSSGNATVTLQTSLGRLTKREKVGSLEVEYMGPNDGGNSRQTQLYWDAYKRAEPFFKPDRGRVGQLTRS